LGIVSVAAWRERPWESGEAVWYWPPGGVASALARTHGVFLGDARDRDDNGSPSSAVPLRRVGDAWEMPLRDDVWVIMRLPRVVRWRAAGDLRSGWGSGAGVGRASA
jgi:hypothetical protein